MKELSIEEKAKAYDEAIEKAKGVIEQNPLMEYLKKGIEYILPELKESENLRIIKAIKYGLDHVFTNNTTVFEVTKEQCLAWLEKQYAHANFRNKIQIGDKVTRNRDGVLVNLSQLNRVAKVDEKQGEQKPILDFKAKDWYLSKVDGKIHNIYHSVDKVEPKFKVGDWITDGNITVQIEAIKNDCYLYCGDCVLYSTKTADKVYHLWTIQDAKNGDVLTYNDSKNNIWVCIFKEYANERVYDYCTLDKESFWEHGNWNYLASFSYTPATKEQRDLLFQKMKEAGYEFDFEKKELKKIEQKPTDEEMKELLRTEYEKGRADAIAEIQNPAWSEEDERIILAISQLLKDCESENGWNCVYSNDREVFFVDMKNWLKSLRPQGHWEPSDEQIHWLKWCVNRMPDTEKANEAEAVLEELLEQLKKLREG